jgi:hypothetical protein
MKIQVEVFWDVTQCSVVIGHQHFGGPYCLHLHLEDLNLQCATVTSNTTFHSEDGGIVVLLNIGILPHNATWCHNPEDLDLKPHIQSTVCVSYSLTMHTIFIIFCLHFYRSVIWQELILFSENFSCTLIIINIHLTWCYGLLGYDTV